MSCWLYAEDLATALIGPFDTWEEAEAHITFCTDRGDAAAAEGTMRVLTDEEAATLRHDIGMEVTPDEDRRWGVTDSE